MHIFILLPCLWMNNKQVHRFTLAVGERTPGAILQTRNGFELVPTGEGEAIVALEGSHPAPGHVGGNHNVGLLRHVCHQLLEVLVDLIKPEISFHIRNDQLGHLTESTGSCFLMSSDPMNMDSK